MSNLNYGVVGNCRTAALISEKGSIDWLCFPDFDSPSIFASLLDRERGGSFGFDVTEDYHISQSYVPHTNILSTSFSSKEGEFVVLDYMPYYRSCENAHYLPAELYRYVRWIKGKPRFKVNYVPAPNYAQGKVIHNVTSEFIESYCSSDNKDRQYLYSSLPLQNIEQKKEIILEKDEFFLLSYNEKVIPVDIEREKIEYCRTLVYWLNWTNRTKKYSLYNDVIERSMLVLKLMSYYNGAVLAALTTSLPESVGEVRNWDYRFCWLRDASMSIETLFQIGHIGAARRFMKFIQSTFVSKHESYQIMYGIRGERQLTEIILEHLIAGIGSLAALLAPYSAYGRIANNLFQPIWQWGNNLLAYLAERADSYAFYETDVWLKSLPTFIIAAATLAVLVVLAGRNGRTYCNTICPVGTVLGFLSRYSLFRITIDSEKCNQCSLCSRNCKAACINFKEHQIDASRCVVCMNCIEKCKHGAISYKYHPFGKPAAGKADSEQINETRRSFFTATALVAATSVLKAQEKKVDGGLAAIEDKKIPKRSTPLTPPGSLSARNMAQHCTACQLCVSACPNQVLRPSADLRKLMQPEMSYERGYCRPECTKCSEVCPAGAIRPITKADKSSVQIGHAVWVKKNCIPLTDGVQCGNCARHCPTGAIQMVPSIPEDKDSPKIPVINVERCIGCGACENLCPARLFSAIYVEGHERHRII